MGPTGGVAALLVPMVPARLKEWAYAGFAITLVSALIAHLAVGDPGKYKCSTPHVGMSPYWW